MTPAFCLSYAIEPALSLLPPSMTSDAARAMLLAIGLQESKFTHRHQIGGPAVSFWQFESAGVIGVLHHRASTDAIMKALAALQYRNPSPHTCATAIEHNDVLAAAFARCLLWTLPGPLPTRGEVDLGWNEYLAAWRPGRPKPDTWADHFAHAWAVVDGVAS